MGPALYQPRLWQLNRQGVALGFSVGLFFGLLVPVLQMPAAAAIAILFRANLLVAIISTLISNPFTYAPIYFFAFRLGALIIGDPVNSIIDESFNESVINNKRAYLYYFQEIFMNLGKPLLVGLMTLAVSTSAVGYVSVLAVWRLATLLEWRHRSLKR